ncbi:hypothetical protein L249_6843 [Ophiocordyceps polyrhachis-furcata BCC 54312]|uniref:G-protein coupled receptors family 2 profile 2 domain-containing protein n=1 Tax=Ophiocordyceps polyrhachis-furcata BCC 54312 TaxID=1330021 RepID=A0A367LKK9_9HYPO|nr:hypothetical protein L249_6843 [Ophiocordyceps polyrhachis-furcata BCC 54312]
MGSVAGLNLCPPPFLDSRLFSNSGGYVEGRLCQSITADLKCCLPCPLADWVYPDSFKTITAAANWVAAVSGISCLVLLVSWAALPIDKTNRHYLSVCLTLGVLMMNLGFIIPLAAQPDQCFDSITPHDMRSSKVCGASGTLLLLGGWCGVMWAFLRSFSLHLQICWQVIVGRNFMIFAQVAGWGIPLVGIVLALVFSGVSFRFGATCHINHPNSLADIWIPLLVFAAATVIITFVTFGYCVKVYLAAMSDNTTSTKRSGLPPYSNSVRTMTPRQAYRRVRRVVALQWRGIAIVLIIIADVIFFSIVFVFQDHFVRTVTQDPKVAGAWSLCLIGASGDKNRCLDEARSLVVNEATVSAVLFLLALNGILLLFLMGRWSMVSGWVDLAKTLAKRRKKEFVSVDARFDLNNKVRTYEMLSKESSAAASPLSATVSPLSSTAATERDSCGQKSYRYHAPSQSYSSPRPPPQQRSLASDGHEGEVNPLGMNDV